MSFLFSVAAIFGLLWQMGTWIAVGERRARGLESHGRILVGALVLVLSVWFARQA